MKIKQPRYKYLLDVVTRDLTRIECLTLLSTLSIQINELYYVRTRIGYRLVRKYIFRSRDHRDYSLKQHCYYRNDAALKLIRKNGWRLRPIDGLLKNKTGRHHETNNY